MPSKIRVAVLDNHQSIIDGYTYRLKHDPSIQIVATALFGDDLEPLITGQPVDVLLMGLSVPNSAWNHTPFPAVYLIPRLLKIQPDLKILVISMFRQQVLIRSLLEVGVRGYILKEDQASIQQLDRIVEMIVNGGIFFSKNAHHFLPNEPGQVKLTHRQLEALSLCAAQPGESTPELAEKLGYADSTLRNLLSAAYRQLGVRNRTAAVEKAQQLGILPSLVDRLAPDSV